MTTSGPADSAAHGPDVAALFAADPHRPGSIDAVLLDRRRVVSRSTAADLYQPPPLPTSSYQRGSRSVLDGRVAVLLTGIDQPVPQVVALARFCAGMARATATLAASEQAGALRLGGTEEQILERGYGTAAELARLLCALAQVAGLPARLAFLASDAPPERHTVTEVYLWGRWAVVDGFSGRLYIWPKHGYASAWDIHLLPQIVDQHPDHGRQPYVESRFYRHVGIASYDLADTAAYDYTDEPTPADLVERLARGLGA